MDPFDVARRRWLGARIWDIRMASAGWVPMADRGSITGNHFDHVHISVF